MELMSTKLLGVFGVWQCERNVQRGLWIPSFNLYPSQSAHDVLGRTQRQLAPPP